MNQSSLFPLHVRSHMPARGRGKDIRTEAIASDGMEWALKRQVEHPMVPATEWLCYRIAGACSLAVPFSAVLIDLDGAAVFGSRIEAGLVDAQDLVQASAIARLGSCAGRMSACYALDLLLGNEDRHFGNFLYRQRADGTLACMPIDWGRSWWVRGWPPQDIMTGANATTTHIQVMRYSVGWVASEAHMTLAVVSSIKVDTIARWLDDMPAGWLPDADKRTLLAWWGGPEFHARIAACIAYCK